MFHEENGCTARAGVIYGHLASMDVIRSKNFGGSLHVAARSLAGNSNDKIVPWDFRVLPRWFRKTNSHTQRHYSFAETDDVFSSLSHGLDCQCALSRQFCPSHRFVNLMLSWDTKCVD